MKCEIFEGLSALRRDSRIGPAVRGCFELLWHLTGGRADYIVVTTKRIAYDFGVERRAVEKWLCKLEEFGLVEVVDRDKRCGTIHLYVFHPRPERREPRPDPQRRLEFPRLDLCAPKGPGERTDASTCAPKGPARLGEASNCARKGPDATNPVGPHARVDSDDDEEQNFIIINQINADDPVWQRLSGAADKLVYEIYRRKGSCPSLSRYQSIFLLSVALLAETMGDGWVTNAVAATEESEKARKPPSYLRTCLVQRYCAKYGCADDCGRRKVESLLAIVETAVGQFLTKTKWRPDQAYLRKRPTTEAECRASSLNDQRHAAAEYPLEPGELKSGYFAAIRKPVAAAAVQHERGLDREPSGHMYCPPGALPQLGPGKKAEANLEIGAIIASVQSSISREMPTSPTAIDRQREISP